MKLTSDEMRDIARAATRVVLKAWDIPPLVKKDLVLGIGPVEDGEDFILYVPAEIPSEGQQISRTVVSRSGEVLSVEVYDEVLRALGATHIDD